MRRGGLRSSNATDGRPPPSEGCFGSLGCGVDQTTAITLRRDGAVAFIACCPDGDDNSRVFAVDARGHIRRFPDTPHVDPGFLRLSADHRHIAYRSAGRITVQAFP